MILSDVHIEFETPHNQNPDKNSFVIHCSATYSICRRNISSDGNKSGGCKCVYVCPSLRIHNTQPIAAKVSPVVQDLKQKAEVVGNEIRRQLLA